LCTVLLDTKLRAMLHSCLNGSKYWLEILFQHCRVFAKNAGFKPEKLL